MRVSKMFRDVPAVVLLQQTQVVVGVVEHDLDRRILEQRAEARGRPDRQRIDHRVACRGSRAAADRCGPRSGGSSRPSVSSAISRVPAISVVNCSTVGDGVEIHERCGVRALCHACSSLCWRIGSRGNVAPRTIASRGLAHDDDTVVPAPPIRAHRMTDSTLDVGDVPRSGAAQSRRPEGAEHPARRRPARRPPPPHGRLAEPRRRADRRARAGDVPGAPARSGSPTPSSWSPSSASCSPSPSRRGWTGSSASGSRAASARRSSSSPSSASCSASAPGWRRRCDRRARSSGRSSPRRSTGWSSG